jgi:hypothetical protein
MNEQHVFSYMDSSFRHSLPEKIERIRPLRAIDFRDEEADEAEHGTAQQPHPQEHAPPALLLEDAPREPSPAVDIDAMDIDRHDPEDDEYEAPEDDDDDKEAPSEQDTDEAASRGESGEMETLSDGGESIHTQVSGREFGTSPLSPRVLDFAGGHEHVTSLSEAEPADVSYRDDQEGDDNDEGNAGDEDEHMAESDDHEGELEGYDEGDLEGDLQVDPVEEEDEAPAEEEAPEEGREEREDDHGEEREDDHDDHQALVEDEAKGVAEKHTPEVATTSRPTSASHRSESGEEVPRPTPPKTKASKRGKHKDRQSKRHSSRVQEPVIAAFVLEATIAGILNKTLPTMLSGLFQEALGTSRNPPPQQVPQPPPTVEVAVGPAEPEMVIDTAVHGVEVSPVDGATHMDASPTNLDESDNTEANVSTRPP